MFKTKKRLGGRRNKTKKMYLQNLKNIYPSCKFDDAKAKEDYSKYTDHKITYGEMEYDGIQQLYSYITKKYNSKINCFIDIGSGRGKLCMFMASQPKIIHVLGIELFEQRHNDAEKLKETLDPEYANKVELINSDALIVDLTKYNQYNIFIWFSNLCFDQETTNKIFEKLNSELPKGTIICCSKQTNNINFTQIDSIAIPMSWNKSSRVSIYQL